MSTRENIRLIARTPYSFYNASVLLKVLYTCLRFHTFQLKRQWKKTDLAMNALSTQHTKPKAACVKRRGAIKRIKLALP